MPDPTGQSCTRIKVGDSVIMLSDQYGGPGEGQNSRTPSEGVTLHVYTKDVEERPRGGARVDVPLDNQFWGER